MTDSLLIDRQIVTQAATLLETARERGDLLATAESCTGGWVAEAVTSFISGAVPAVALLARWQIGEPLWLRNSVHESLPAS